MPLGYNKATSVALVVGRIINLVGFNLALKNSLCDQQVLPPWYINSPDKYSRASQMIDYFVCYDGPVGQQCLG